MRKILVCLLASVVVLSACSDAKKTSTTTTTSSTTTIPVPTFKETPETLKVPNPCEVISIENVKSVIKDPMVRGPLIQNAVAPSKACEWTISDQTYPRLGVSIALSQTFYDASEASKVADASIGDKAFIVKDFITGFGGTSCGQTIIVKKGEYSFSVAVCNAKNKMPTSKQLVKLAKDVLNSLP